MYNHRSERLIFVKGTAEGENDNELKFFSENESKCISVGT